MGTTFGNLMASEYLPIERHLLPNFLSRQQKDVESNSVSLNPMLSDPVALFFYVNVIPSAAI